MGASAPGVRSVAGCAACLPSSCALAVRSAPAARATRPAGRHGDESAWRGTLLGDPWTKPEFTLTDINGQPFDFRAGTDGYLTLLFFGYTHCPDVCPLHMANLAAVLDTLPGDVRVNTKVVFATTDPARDTPVALKKWLGNFNPTFIGLTGTADEMAAAQRAAGIPVSVAEPPKADGSVRRRPRRPGHRLHPRQPRARRLPVRHPPVGLGRRPPPPARRRRPGTRPHDQPSRRVGSLRRRMTRSTDPTAWAAGTARRAGGGAGVAAWSSWRCGRAAARRAVGRAVHQRSPRPSSAREATWPPATSRSGTRGARHPGRRDDRRGRRDHPPHHLAGRCRDHGPGVLGPASARERPCGSRLEAPT